MWSPDVRLLDALISTIATCGKSRRTFPGSREMLCHALIDCALFHEHFGQYLGIRLGENSLTNGRKNWVHSTRMLRIIVDSSAHVAPTHQELGGLHKMKIEKKKKKPC